MIHDVLKAHPRLTSDSRLSGAIIQFGIKCTKQHAGLMGKELDHVMAVIPKICIDPVTKDVSYVENNALSTTITLSGNKTGGMPVIDLSTVPLASYNYAGDGSMRGRFGSVCEEPGRSFLGERAVRVNQLKGDEYLSNLSYFRFPEMKAPQTRQSTVSPTPSLSAEENSASEKDVLVVRKRTLFESSDETSSGGEELPKKKPVTASLLPLRLRKQSPFLNLVM
mmetsp:Transcript_10236/g.16771  ORF Transcript_10236/g.16771 Transcript_10236/m.16771 type:complete len:223 (+) Transcript_10236:424-1092(+)